MIKYCSVLAAGCLALSAAAWDMPLSKYAQRHTFEKRALAGSKNLKLLEYSQGNKALSIPSNAYAYGRLAFPGGKCGTITVCFDCKWQSPAQKNSASLTLSFRAPGKGNGSAGSVNAVIDAAGKWQRIRKVFDVSEKAEAVQFIFRARGDSNALLIDNLEIVYTSDVVSVPVSAVPVNFNADNENKCWNPQTGSGGMFTQLVPSRAACFMQFAADKKGLYILYNNFVDPQRLTVKAAKRDGAVYDDDANEILFFDEGRQTGWQFMLNAAGVPWDGVLYQRMHGDPWRSDSKWNNSDWKYAAKVKKNGFETRFFIPWKLLNIDPAKGGELLFNAGGDYPAFGEFPKWNVYRGTRFDLAKFGKIKVENNQVTFSRVRNVEALKYDIPRKNAKYRELLETGTPGNYRIAMFTHDLGRHNFSKELMKNTSDEKFKAYQDEIFRVYKELGIGGPNWPHTFYYGRDRMMKLYEQGMRFPMSLGNSSRTMKAKREGATLVNPHSRSGVDSNDPVFVKILTDSIYAYRDLRDYEFIKKSLSFVMGVDEPTNSVEICYDPNQNKENVAALKVIDEKVRKDYGFGKFGIPFFSEVSAADLPFARIAFYRYWNCELVKNFTKLQKVVKEVFPDTIMNIFDDNNCSGQSTIDAALYNGTAELIAVDTYPTSTCASYGMARALYHTGFSCRVLGDLVPSAKLMVIPQGFVYHGGHGNDAAMREWVSQALKNGADWFMWYSDNAVTQIFKDFSDMLEISAELKQMDKLVLPEKTDTLLFYSCYDKWAKADRAMHSTYSVYVMLAEVLGCNFRMISESTVERGDVKLDDYKLMYIPAMTYTAPELSEKIAAWVRNGGTLVTFDPHFMMYNSDGSFNRNRQELTGMTSGAMPVKKGQCGTLLYSGKTLPMAQITNAPSLPGNSFYAFDPGKVAGKVIARYQDKSPAAWQRNIGKGKVIAFAIQPFAGSDLVSRPGAWRDFFAQLAREHNEAIDLPVRDFLMPKPPARIKLKKILGN